MQESERVCSHCGDVLNVCCSVSIKIKKNKKKQGVHVNVNSFAGFEPNYWTNSNVYLMIVLHKQKQGRNTSNINVIKQVQTAAELFHHHIHMTDFSYSSGSMSW